MKLPKPKLLALALSSVFLAIVIVELILRFSGVFILPTHLTQRSEKLGFEHIPNAKAINKSTDFEVKVTINSQGLRDYEISREKPANIKRIALVGDSFVEGIQVELEQTVAKKLEENLGKEEYQVINFGVAGYGIDQKFLYIKEKVINFKPDTIILFLSANDLDDVKNNGLLKKQNDKLIFQNQTAESTKVRKIKNLLRNSYLANFLFLLNLKRDSTPGNGLSLEYKLYRGVIDDEVKTYLDLTKNLILESKKLSMENNAQFILVIGADRIQANPKFTAEFIKNYPSDTYEIDFFNKYFVKFAIDKNIVYLDLLPIFKNEIENNNNVYFPSDGHWNQYGHEIVAKHLLKILKEEVHED